MSTVHGAPALSSQIWLPVHWLALRHSTQVWLVVLHCLSVASSVQSAFDSHSTQVSIAVHWSAVPVQPSSSAGSQAPQRPALAPEETHTLMAVMALQAALSAALLPASVHASQTFAAVSQSGSAPLHWVLVRHSTQLWLAVSQTSAPSQSAVLLAATSCCRW